MEYFSFPIINEIFYKFYNSIINVSTIEAIGVNIISGCHVALQHFIGANNFVTLNAMCGYISILFIYIKKVTIHRS